VPSAYGAGPKPSAPSAKPARAFAPLIFGYVSSLLGGPRPALAPGSTRAASGPWPHRDGAGVHVHHHVGPSFRRRRPAPHEPARLPPRRRYRRCHREGPHPAALRLRRAPGGQMLTLSVLAYLGVGPSPRSARAAGRDGRCSLRQTTFEPGQSSPKAATFTSTSPRGRTMARTTLSVMSLVCPAARRGHATQSDPAGMMARDNAPISAAGIGAAEKGHDDIGRSCRPRDRDPRGKLSDSQPLGASQTNTGGPALCRSCAPRAWRSEGTRAYPRPARSRDPQRGHARP